MATKARKRRKSNISLLDEPIQPPLTTTIRTQVGRRVSNRAVQERSNPGEVLPNPHRQGQTSLAINNEIGFEDNHLLDSHTTSLPIEEDQLISRTPQQDTCDQLITRISEAQHGHNEIQENDKNCRGPTYMLEIWGRPSTLPPIQLDFDRYGSPIGPNQSKFCEFLGTIARNGMYCPLDVEDWHKMPKEYKKKMLDIVKSRYDITLGDEGRILSSINKKWRNWKSLLKTRYFIPDKELRCLKDEKDGRVVQEQWMNILAYWNKEEVKVRSEKNKVARSKRTMNHLTGKTPFAKVRDKLAKEKGHYPSRAQMLDACYTNSKNTPSIVSKYLEQIEELRSQLPEGSEDPVGPNDLFAQVCGQDKPGRVRMFGEGISPSDVWGEVPNRNMCKRIMLEQRSELLKVNKEVAELRSELMAQKSSQSITSVSNNLLRPSSSNQHIQVGVQVALRSIFDQGTTVAKGYIQSIDPNAEVGRQVLGDNWCQVCVKVILRAEEPLVRPYGYCQTIEDALGEMVAWPCNFVTPIG